MKALILAAGIGSRLSPITDSVPKALVPVNGKPIIINQIDCLMNCGINEIFVVTGYKSEIMRAKISEKYKNVVFIENKDYLITNNMYSALLGKNYIGEKDFIMMNADVFIDETVIRSLIDFEENDAIVVDEGTYNIESMKVVENNGNLIKISKEIDPNEALGCSIDIYKFSKSTGDLFFKKCEEYIIENEDKKKWSEVALNDILPLCNFKSCKLNGRWFEIDNFDDLKKAEELFG